MNIKIRQMISCVFKICRATNAGPMQYVKHILRRNTSVIEILYNWRLENLRERNCLGNLGMMGETVRENMKWVALVQDRVSVPHFVTRN
jgi:hypothetical protein